MLNQTTMLPRVGTPMIAIRLMVGSLTDATRGIPSAQGLGVTPDLIRKLSAQTSNFAIIPSTAAAGEIQGDYTKDSDLFGASPRSPQPSPRPAEKMFPNLSHQ